MTLIVIECAPSTYQTLVPSSPIMVNTIRPHLYLHGSPTGTVKVQIQNSGGTMLYESAPVTITSLKTQTYAHGYYAFSLPANLEKDTTYRIAVVCGGGYSFSESNYIGVCLDFDNRKTNISYSAPNSFYSPLDIEIWQRINV